MALGKAHRGQVGFWGEGTISEDQYRELDTLRMLGLVSIAAEPVPVLSTTVGGASKIITASLTADGEMVNVAHSDELHPLFGIRTGTYDIKTIIRNSAIRVGVHDYRLILATYTAHYDKTYRSIRALEKRAMPVDKKARILMKYDPFQNSWSVLTEDLAGINDSFHSDNVDKAISVR